jgi:hypothetical protein
MKWSSEGLPEVFHNWRTTLLLRTQDPLNQGSWLEAQTGSQNMPSAP